MGSLEENTTQTEPLRSTFYLAPKKNGVAGEVGNMVDLGQIGLSSYNQVEFTRVNPGPDIIKVMDDCGCGEVFWNKDNVYISYGAPISLPEYYRNNNMTHMEVEKQFSVLYADKSLEVLLVKATIVAPR